MVIRDRDPRGKVAIRTKPGPLFSMSCGHFYFTSVANGKAESTHMENVPGEDIDQGMVIGNRVKVRIIKSGVKH
jgi:hypothetical protein